MNYHRVYDRIWMDPDLRALGPLCRDIALYCLSGPQTNRVGLFPLSLGAMHEHLGEEIPATAFESVLAWGEWHYDRRAHVLWIPSWWKWNLPSGPGHLESILRDLADVPKTPLLEQWTSRLSDLPPAWQAGARRVLGGEAFTTGRGTPRVRRPGTPVGSRGGSPPPSPPETPPGSPAMPPPGSRATSPGWVPRGSDPDPDPDPDPVERASARSSRARAATSGDAREGGEERGSEGSTERGRTFGMPPPTRMVPRPASAFHPNCRPPCVRVCVSHKQHAVLAQRYGGADPDAALDAFYAEVRARLPDDQPIGERPWEFWEAQFQAAFGTSKRFSRTQAQNAAVWARTFGNRGGT